MTKGSTTAIILAAGSGERMPSELRGVPKGLIEVGGEPLVARELRLLRAHGFGRVVIVVGYRGECYRQAFGADPDVELVENPDFARTGSLVSLAHGLGRVDADVLLLESDLLFEARAIEALLRDPRPDVTLVSGLTGAGDEVWVEAEDGWLRGLSKQRSESGTIFGEFVGITRISRALGRNLAELARTPECRAASYETAGLVAAAAKSAVGVCLVPDLVWGELDDASHLERLRSTVAPAIRAREGRG